MSEFEQQPDDLWRKAFDEAAETPPPRVWDAIERRLDESEGPRVLPLWGTGLGASRMLRWGAGLAAAIAVLLVGWWTLSTQPSPNADTSVAQTSVPQRRITKSDVSASNVSTTPDESNTPAEVRLSGRPGVSLAQTPTTSPNRISRSATVQSTPDIDRRTLALNSDRRSGQRRTPAEVARQNPVESLAQNAVRLPGVAVLSADPMSTPAAALVAGQPGSQPVVVTPSANTLMFAPAAQPAVADQVVQPTNTSVAPLAAQPAAAARESAQSLLANDARLAEPEAVQSKRKSREVWASVSMMPGAFDPAVAVRGVGAPTLANSTAYNYAVSNVPPINSHANFSVAYQASAGIQLTERWSVESGVGYLSGRSTVDSPTQVSPAYVNQFAGSNGLVAVDPGKAGNSTVSSLYVDLLRGQASTAQAAGALANADALFISNSYRAFGNYSNQTRQALSNDYQYVQVPVQVGYQLRPRKRLGLALLGGFLTNIFVRNTVADELVITSRDGVYRPLSWAASLGARFRYRPSRRWSASLAGLYQPSLGLGTRPESVVQSQPTSVGMSFGVDYHF